ncbi:SDR family oxidoreductase [Peribacillus cavernae]|uniref:SDR family oxidoreductase n=2 Tax=Peribacillus cavernae TaxID=1674310 RepID=A0A3S0UAQ1_9BACI|nr:NAD(P)-dependent dehydrogenase (short-subunit alcohol dehydrogenase family) [Peribacillus cavernae]RUQ27116.1 SDR family oxidoreductase [Peribacillus cavernae]
MINNSGWDKVETFLKSKPSTWKKIVDINLLGHIQTYKEILPNGIRNRANPFCKRRLNDGVKNGQYGQKILCTGCSFNSVRDGGYKMELDLEGRNILVTGAAKGIGRGIALEAVSRGANIALHYQSSEKEALETAKLIEESGVKTVLVTGDLASIEDVQNMKKSIERDLGTVDDIVNNAGWTQYKSFFKYEPGEWKREVEVCFYGVLHLAHTFMPDMMENKRGKFINIIGDSARTGDRNLIISGAARSGTISFLKSLAQEVGRNNIQCNTVSLGLIDQGQGYDSVMMEKLMKQYPLKRLGKVDDVTGIILFLLSSYSDWVTGQVFSVNGGHSMLG